MFSTLSSSALLLSLLTSYTSALALPQPASYDNGQWTQAANTYQSATALAATVTATGSATATVTTKATVVATGTAATATAGWEMTAIWPNGCDAWANPCPAGAHMSNGMIAGSGTKTGSVVGYENGFTSFTTMTDANGVITGMPAVATVAAGVSTTMNTSSSRNSTSTKTTLSTGTSTQSGFSTGSSTRAAAAVSTGGANVKSIGKAALMVGAAGLVALF